MYIWLSGLGYFIDLTAVIRTAGKLHDMDRRWISDY